MTWPRFCFLHILPHTKATKVQKATSPKIPPITPPAIVPAEDEELI